MTWLELSFRRPVHLVSPLTWHLICRKRKRRREYNHTNNKTIKQCILIEIAKVSLWGGRGRLWWKLWMLTYTCKCTRARERARVCVCVCVCLCVLVFWDHFQSLCLFIFRIFNKEKIDYKPIGILKWSDWGAGLQGGLAHYGLNTLKARRGAHPQTKATWAQSTCPIVRPHTCSPTPRLPPIKPERSNSQL